MCRRWGTENANEGGKLNDWLIALARDAGTLAMDMRAAGFEQQRKPDGTLVTSADIAVDRLLHEQIARKHPEDCVLSEESPDPADRTRHSRVWILDPIDGTSYFAARQDEFGILIALCVDGEAVETVAHFPALELTLYAKKGEGALVNRRRVHVSGNRGAEERVYTSPSRLDGLNTVVRRVANNALAVFQVITGELDGAVLLTSPSTGEHDYAWASCAVEAAGGQMTGTDGRRLRYNKPVRRMPPIIVCSNGHIHTELIDKVNAFQMTPRGHTGADARTV
jgi:fructose-1,6-bisphosphatase/inositol monophosphatase family enzyme